MNIPENIEAVYQKNVTGPMAGCKHVRAVLEWVMSHGSPSVKRLAENFCRTGHGACWNALCGNMDADAWFRFYAGSC